MTANRISDRLLALKPGQTATFPLRSGGCLKVACVLVGFELEGVVFSNTADAVATILTLVG
jgi:hypothetical protein